MEKAKHRVLIATDCLSEGVNLQHLFTGVLHYDLPWNPNRLEQREGRVERFSSLMDKQKFQVVYPVLPMDLLGAYILLPEVAQ